MVILFTILYNVAEAVFDGLVIRGKKLLGNTLKSLLKASLLAIALFYFSGWQFLWYDYIPIERVIIGFVLLRYAIFDLIFNLTAKLHINYIGNTKIYDKVLMWIKERWGMSPIWFSKAIAVFWGVAWLLGK